MSKTPSKSDVQAYANVGAALVAIDNLVRGQQGGEPGTGIFSLLELVAVQLVGVPRSQGFTPPAPDQEEQDENGEQDEADDKQPEKQQAKKEPESKSAGTSKTPAPAYRKL